VPPNPSSLNRTRYEEGSCRRNSLLRDRWVPLRFRIIEWSGWGLRLLGFIFEIMGWKKVVDSPELKK
jgi:hypothetical protein